MEAFSMQIFKARLWSAWGSKFCGYLRKSISGKGSRKCRDPEAEYVPGIQVISITLEGLEKSDCEEKNG